MERIYLSALLYCMKDIDEIYTFKIYGLALPNNNLSQASEEGHYIFNNWHIYTTNIKKDVGAI